MTRSVGKNNSESSSNNGKLWNKNWNLNIPPKARIFIWKAVVDIIATESNLADHHVRSDPRCSIFLQILHGGVEGYAVGKHFKEVERSPNT